MRVKKILLFIGAHAAPLIVAGVLVTIAVFVGRLQLEKNALIKQKEAAFQQVASLEKAVAGDKANAASLYAQANKLGLQVEELKKAGGRVSQVQHSTATIKDTVKIGYSPDLVDSFGNEARPGDVATYESDGRLRWAKPAPGAPALADHYNRWTIRADGTMDRNESFSYDAAFVTSPDGTARVVKERFVEHDPVTGLAILDEQAPRFETHFSFAPEEKPAVAALHPRVVAAADMALRFGGGIQFLNGERLRWPIINKLNVSAIALYDKAAKSGTGALALGYRLGKTNFSVGPYYGITLPGGATSIGLAGTLEVTR
jgi:hypothetical protein